MAMVVTLFTLLTGIALVYTLLLVNHYRFSRKKMLILSRGNDVFYYGSVENPEKFDKKNILEIITHGRRGRGNSYRRILVRVEISLTDGRSVNISSLLIDQILLVGKFPGLPQREEKEWLPFIPRAASIPS
jgi:hypothetical protein